MSAPLKTDTTGSPVRFGAIILVLFIVFGSLVYAARLPANTNPPVAAQTTSDSGSTPQVAGVQTEGVDTPTPNDPVIDIPNERYQVTASVDGDTIKVTMNGKTETLRLIGVDTPETKDPRKKVQCFGAQAAAYTAQVLTGKQVRLAADDTQDNRDKYGRLLRYIFLEDGTNFNQQLIADGYAYEYTYKVPYLFQTQFKDAQTNAQSAQKGLWSPTTCNGVR